MSSAMKILYLFSITCADVQFPVTLCEQSCHWVIFSIHYNPAHGGSWKLRSLQDWKTLATINQQILPTHEATSYHTISAVNSQSVLTVCCCLPTPMTLASGGSPMFPLVVYQPASPSIWPAVQSLWRGLSTNPGVTMWCVCGCS